MQNFTVKKERKLALAPGLSGIIDTAEAAGWSVKREAACVELLKPAGQPEGPVGFVINSNWWCRDLGPAKSKSFRVTAPTLLQLLGLSSSR